MLKNFFKTTFRNLLKNKSYVIINVLGLSLSLACCIVAYLNYKVASDYDSNHQNQDRIYKIQVNKLIQDNKVPYGITPLPLGANLADQLSEVEYSTRFAAGGIVFKKDNNVIEERLGFGEDNFFKIFTFPFKYGSQEAFFDPGKIILSEETAEKLYGDTDPTDELVTLVKDDGTVLTKIVGGVLEKIPSNSSIHFNGLMHLDSYFTLYEMERNNWKSFVGATFIMTKTNSRPKEVLTTLNDNYIQIQNEARDDWKVGEYTLESLNTLGVNGEDVRANWLREAPPKPAILVPLIMAILMLLIACFNFTNTSIAISSKRLKEIGIRKVMGGNKRQLIAQFMGENLILTVIALAFSIILAMYLVPAYSAMWDFIELKLDFSSDPELYVFLGGLLIFTSLVAGAYPSIYVSSYQPVKILKGNLSLGGTSFFSKALLTSQYVLTAIALIASLAFSQNAKYQADLDVGFEKENIIFVRVASESVYDRLAQRIQQNPDILQVAQTEEHISMWNYSRTLKNEDKEMETFMMDLGLDYPEVMDLKMVKGRYFTKDLYEHDKVNSIVVNEKLVEEFGWEEPIGKMVQIDDSTRLQVVGVMKNFYMEGFWDPLEPYGFRPAHKDRTNFAVIKIKPGQLKASFESIEQAWYEVEPNKPFTGRYQDEFIKNADTVNSNIMVMFSFLGILALILSSIGLFTLVSLNIIKRIKEIGVRKVLGASVGQIITKINVQFVWIIGISILVGGVLSYLAIDALMGSIFAYYKAVSVTTLLIPIFILLLVAFLTSAGRTFGAARKNPVDSLRYE
ncbi:MAG: FtsX-like permease family protein [Marinoscillum sp.]